MNATFMNDALQDDGSVIGKTTTATFPEVKVTKKGQAF
jgi:hypothetical protein